MTEIESENLGIFAEREDENIRYSFKRSVYTFKSFIEELATKLADLAFEKGVKKSGYRSRVILTSKVDDAVDELDRELVKVSFRRREESALAEETLRILRVLVLAKDSVSSNVLHKLLTTAAKSAERSLARQASKKFEEKQIPKVKALSYIDFLVPTFHQLAKFIRSRAYKSVSSRKVLKELRRIANLSTAPKFKSTTDLNKARSGLVLLSNKLIKLNRVSEKQLVALEQEVLNGLMNRSKKRSNY